MLYSSIEEYKKARREEKNTKEYSSVAEYKFEHNKNNILSDISAKIRAYDTEVKKYEDIYNSTFFNSDGKAKTGYIGNVGEQGKAATIQAANIVTKRNDVQNVINKWSDYLDNNYKDSINKYFEESNTELTKLSEGFQKSYDHYKNFKNADEYKQYEDYLKQEQEKAAKEKEYIANYDADSAKKELDKLRNLYENYSDWGKDEVNRNLMPFGYSTLRRLENDLEKKEGDYGMYLALTEKYNEKPEEFVTVDPLRAEGQHNLNNLKVRAEANEKGGYITEIGGKGDKDVYYFKKHPEEKFATFATNDEYNVYSRLKEKGEDKAAEVYMKSLDDQINARMSGTLYEGLYKNNPNKYAFAFQAGGTGAFEQTKNFFDSLDAVIHGEEIETSVPLETQVLSQITSNAKGGEKFVLEALGTTAAMAPAVLLSFVPFVGTGLSSAMLYSQASGAAISEAKSKGYTDEQAMQYGTLVGASELALEKFLGGLPGISKLSSKAVKTLEGVDNLFYRLAGKGLLSGASEFTEEFAQAYLEPYIATIVADEEYDPPALLEALYQGLIGMATGVGMSTVAAIPGEVNTYMTGEELMQTPGVVEKLINAGANIPQTSKLAEKVTAHPTAYNIGRLYEAVGQVVTPENAEGTQKYTRIKNELFPAVEQSPAVSAKAADRINTAFTQAIDKTDLTEEAKSVIAQNFVFPSNIDPNSYEAERYARDFAEEAALAYEAGEIQQKTGEKLPDGWLQENVRVATPEQLDYYSALGRESVLADQVESAQKEEAKAYIKKGNTNQLLNMDSKESPQHTLETFFDSSATNEIVTQDSVYNIDNISSYPTNTPMGTEAGYQIADIKKFAEQKTASVNTNQIISPADSKDQYTDEIKKIDQDITDSVIDLSLDNELVKIIEGETKTQKYKLLQKHIFDVLGGQELVLSDGRKAIVDKRDSQHLVQKAGNKKVAYLSKIKEIITTAKIVAYELEVDHNKFSDFYYYKALVRLGGEVFPIYVNVGKAKNDKTNHIYDVTKKIRDSANLVGLERPKPNEGYALKNAISNKNISQPNQNVNRESLATEDKQYIADTPERAQSRKKLLARSVDEVRTATRNDATLTAEQRETAEIGEKLGVAVGYEDTTQYYSTKRDGIFLKSKGVMILDKNAEQPLKQLLVHELAHFSETSKSYAKLSKTILESKALDNWLTEKGYTGSFINKKSAYRVEKKNAYSENGATLTKDGADAEMIANFLGETIGTEEKFNAFMSELTGEQKKNFLDYIKEVIDWFKATFTNSVPAEIRRIEKLYKKAIQESADSISKSKSSLKQKNNLEESNIKYSLKGYSQHQIDNWANNKNIIIYENAQQLKQFIDEALKGQNLSKKIYFGAIPEELAIRIKKDTGIEIENFNCTLRATEIRKIISDHGNEETEKLRGQRAIVEDDFIAIPQIIQNPDEIRLSDKQFEGKPVIEFVKTINGKTTVVAYVSKKHLDLTVQTMYSGIKKGNLATAAGDQAPANTPEAHVGTVPNNSISENSKNVNREYSATEDEQFSISENAKPDVKKVLTDKHYQGEIKLTDSSPSIMLSQKGVRNLPMIMNASHIRENVLTEEEARKLGLKVNQYINYHGLGEELFLKVIEGLDNVTEAYRGTKNAEKSQRRENYFLLISEYKDTSGNTINIPVYINEKGMFNRVFIDTNKISTVFGKENLRSYLNRELKLGNIVKVKKGSTQTSESTSPINADYRMNASTNNISQPNQIVNKESLATEDEQFSIAPQSFSKDKYFDSQIDKWEDLKYGAYVKVGTLDKSHPIVKVGMPSGAIRYDVSKLKKNMSDHGVYLTKELLKAIPDIIANPIAISEYQKGKTISVFGNYFVNNSPMMVGITISRDRAGNDINKVRTYNARRDVSKLITDSSILYLNENKKMTRKWFQACGIQVPLGETKFSVIRSISQTTENVNKEYSATEDVQFSISETDKIAGKRLSSFIDSVSQMIDKSRISKRKLKIGSISKNHANLIEPLMNTILPMFSAEGYELWIDGTGAEHIIDRHGENGDADSSMAQKEKQELIPWVANNPDKAEFIKGNDGNIELSKRYFNSDQTKAPQIKLTKVVDGDFVYVSECVPDSLNKRIYITSAYIEKNSTNQLLNIDSNESPQPTSETSFDGSAIINSISQTTENVNTEQYSIPGEAIDERKERVYGNSIPERTRKLRQDFVDGKISYTQLVDGEAKLMKEAREKYGTIKEGENPQERVKVPQGVEKNKNVSQYVRTILETGAVSEALAAKMGKKTLLGDFSHEISTDKKALEDADSAIKYGTAKEKWYTAVGAIHSIPTKNEIAVGEKLLEKAMKEGKTIEALEIASDLVNVYTRAGQLVQSARLLKQMTGTGRLIRLQRTVNRINEDIQKKNDKISKEHKKHPLIKISENLAEELVKANTADDVEEIAKEIEHDVASQMQVTWLDKWNAWRYLSMLGNPLTHVRNVVGNGIFVPVVSLKKTIGTGLENFIPAEQRTRALKVDKVYKEFAENDVKSKDIQDILDGTDKMTGEAKAMRNRRIFKNKILHFLSTFNKNALSAEDAVFKNYYYKTALASFLQARNIDLSNISEEQLSEARAFAVNEALKSTYNDVSKIAGVVKKLESQGKFANIFVNGVVPFKQTPINIIKRGVEYSPLGLIYALGVGIIKLKEGQITAAQFIDGVSAGGSGTIVFAIGALLASLGWVTGGFGDDDEDKFKKLAGEQEYALQVFGKSYTLDWAAPISIPFFIGVELINSMRKKNDGFTLQDMGDIVWNSLDPIVNLSMLSGLENTISSIRYADGAEMLGASFESVFASYFGQAVPTIGGKIAGITDDLRRSNYIDKNSQIPSFLQSMYNSAIAKIPGVSDSRNAYIDAWGRTVSQGGIVERFLENFISPGYFSDVDYTDVDLKLLELFEATGETSMFPNSASKYIIVDKVRKELTADEYVKYAATKGQYSFAYLKEFFASDYADELTHEEQIKAIEKICDYANEKAKAVISEYNVEKNNKTAYKEEEDGRSVVDYFSNKVKAERYAPSLYNQALDDGDFEEADRLKAEIIEWKMENGKTKRDADSELKSSVTSYWKPLYIEAYSEKNSPEVQRIRELLKETGYFPNVNSVVGEWYNDYKKKQREVVKQNK